MKNIVSSLNTWLDKESKTFSIIGGERFTHAEVITANVLGMLILTVALVVGNALG